MWFKPVMIVFFGVVLTACSGEEKNEHDVDVSNIEVEMQVHRMDEDLRLADTSDLTGFSKRMMGKYHGVWESYVSRVLVLGSAYDPMFADNLKRYLSLPYIAPTMKAVDSMFTDLSSFNQKFEAAFKHLKYYYPDADVPPVVYTHGFFGFGTEPLDSAIAVGLDFYLGPNHPLILSLPREQFPDYMKTRMDAQYLVTDALFRWFEVAYVGENKFTNFLGAMIHYGKVMYALDLLLPDESDMTKIRYTKDQLQWAMQNEEKIWMTLVDRKMVHSTKIADIRGYFQEGPFTPGLVQNEAPPRIGVFIGWQIVKDYMAAHPDLSIQDLLEQTNDQKILSSYKPGTK